MLYWKSETESELKKHHTSRKTLQKLLRESAFGYYGLLAHRRLGLTPKFKKAPSFFKILSQSALDIKTADMAYWLNSLDEEQLLSSFLQFQEKSYHRKKQTKEDWIRFFALQNVSKNYLKLFQSLARLQPELKNYFLTNHMHLFFPQEYENYVEQSSTSWEISKALVFAVIRQESTFDRRARSAKDAFGLMQLIPRTARSISNDIKAKYRGVSDLYIPKKNIHLGTYYLKHLLSRYKNSFILNRRFLQRRHDPCKKMGERTGYQKTFGIYRKYHV